MRQCFLFILVVAMCVATATAQDEDVLRPNGRGDNDGVPRTEPKQSTRFIIGPELGLNLNMFSSTVTGGAEQSEINVLKSGSGVSAFFGAYFEVGINREFGIGARLLYDMKSASNSFDSAIRDCEIIAPGIVQGVVAEMPFRMDYEQRITYITINPLLRWSPTEELIIQAGPVIQLAASDLNVDITRTIDEDEICRFIDSSGNQTAITHFSGVDTAATSTRFGIDIGIGYRMAIAPSIALVPRIGYQLMFSTIGPDVEGLDESQNASRPAVPFSQTDRKLSSLQASIALWFTL